MMPSGRYVTNGAYNALRCEGITGGGLQCKCYAVQRVNNIPLCKQHAEKELRAGAMNETPKKVR